MTAGIRIFGVTSQFGGAPLWSVSPTERGFPVNNTARIALSLLTSLSGLSILVFNRRYVDYVRRTSQPSLRLWPRERSANYDRILSVVVGLGLFLGGVYVLVSALI